MSRAETTPAWLAMAKSHIEIHGDPFAPRPGPVDPTSQTAEARCQGCGAVGEMRPPKWEPEIDHAPGCPWLAWKGVLDGNT